MAAPTIVNSVTGFSGSISTTRTVTLPTNIADDYIFVALMDDPVSQTFTIPGGWTRLYDTVDVVSAATFILFYKKSNGSEGASINVTVGTTEEASWIAFSVRGAHASSPIHAQGTNATGTGGTATIPAITTSIIDTLVIGVIATDDVTTTHGATTDYTQLAESANDTSVSVWYKTQATAATISANTSTLTDNEQWLGVSFAIAFAGTAYTQSEAGTVTTSGTMSRRTLKALAGTITSSGIISAIRDRVVARIIFTLRPRVTAFTIATRNIFTLGNNRR